MADTPKDLRLMLIEAKRSQADRLLAAANHETLKAQVRLAIRDLDEALHWLNQENVDRRPAILTIVDMATGMADHRLGMVKKALDTYGADAMLIG